MKRKGIIAVLLILVYGIGVGSGLLLYKPLRAVYHEWRDRRANAVTMASDFEKLSDSAQALAERNDTVLKTETYGDFDYSKSPKTPNKDGDVKKLYIGENRFHLANFADGYFLSVPKGSEFDYSLAEFFVTIRCSDELELTVTREYSPYDEIDEYFDYYLNRFVLNENFREQNRITLLQNENTELAGYPANLISARLEDCPDGINNVYTYALFKTGGRTYYRIMAKYRDYEGQKEGIDEILNSFAVTEFYGVPTSQQQQYTPREAKNWNYQTKQVYKELLAPQEKVKWGVYTGYMDDKGINELVPALEEKIDYSFDVLMTYFDVDYPPPTAFMKQAQEEGKMVELTMHVTSNSNTDVYGYTPMLDIYRGEKDDQLRMIARELAQIDIPFFLRLNNEMNSDWTSYSGVVNLSDPEIYKSVWRRVYQIFEEEGVKSAIWVFNPNDRNYPPCNWNNYMAYFPGDDVVQMIGVTGYNTGDYYATVFGEEWREFKEIYDHVQAQYQKNFEAYPWIITEFASSSYGGDKAAWIRSMFRELPNYPNIKVAVWYSLPDMDFRPEYKGQIARPYMLDETPETAAAFREGLKEYLAK